MATVSPPATTQGSHRPRSGVWSRLLLAVVLIGGLTWLLLVLAGVFREKVSPEVAASPAPSAEGVPWAEVRVLRRPRYESAVGVVRAVHEAALASKLLAKVVEVNVKAGQAVERGEVLVRLDDADLQARFKQAEAAVASAEAARTKAAADFERARQLVANKVITQAEYDQAAAAKRASEAEFERAQQALQEARIVLDYTVIRAPLTGVVVDKRVEVGDTVVPGQVLLTLYDPTRMQMVATVREALAERLQVGHKIPARLEALKHECEATISEIVPEAQTASRSFTVKVTGPCPPGVYSGMFGRIFIPLDEEELTVVPAEAVFRVGQLTMVDVIEEGRLRRRSVQLGRQVDGAYEVLSGLQAGDKVALLRRGEEAAE